MIYDPYRPVSTTISPSPPRKHREKTTPPRYSLLACTAPLPHSTAAPAGAEFFSSRRRRTPPLPLPEPSSSPAVVAALHRCPAGAEVFPSRRRNPRPPLTAQRSFQAATALHRSLPPPAQWWFHLLPDQCPGLPPTVPRSFPAAAALYHSLPPPATRCVPTAVSLLLPQITSGYLRSMPPPAQRWFPLPPEPRPGLPPPRPRWFLHPPEAGAASGPAPPAPRWFPAHLCLPPFFAICSRKCVMQVL